MNIAQVYEETIKPLAVGDKLTLARMIINDVAPSALTAAMAQPEEGFDYLRRILPQIEKITVTDRDLMTVSLPNH